MTIKFKIYYNWVGATKRHIWYVGLAKVPFSTEVNASQCYLLLPQSTFLLYRHKHYFENIESSDSRTLLAHLAQDDQD